MRTGTIGTAALAALLAWAPATAFAASKTIDVGPFTEIEISSGIDATVAIGDTQEIVAESPDAAQLDELIVEVRGGRFHAYVDWNVLDLFDFGIERNIRLTITAPKIEGVEANSGSDVTASGLAADTLSLSSSSGANLTVRDISAASLTAEASSGADIDISGTCDSGRFESSSGADLDARDLICRTVDVEASSGADAAVHATDAVDAEASSGASVDVHGSPGDVQSDESSGGDVTIH